MCLGWLELPTKDYHVRVINETPTQMYQKLGQLEDIEDELGIDLITLFKALKSGVYRWRIDVYGDYDKSFNKKVFQDVELDISSKKLYHISEISGTPTWELKLKDYGKTWSLTKEELEK